jgi:hypothetical protein
MKINSTLCFLSVFSLFFVSCSNIDLVKRKYRPGYFVQSSAFRVQGPTVPDSTFGMQKNKIEPQTMNIENRILNIEHRILNIEPGTSNPGTLNIEHRTLNLEPGTLNLEQRTLNAEPESIDVKEGSASFALSLAGILVMAICWTFSYPVLLVMAGLGFLITIIGLVLGARVLSRHRGDRNDYPGRRSAVTGMVIGIVGASLGLALVLVLGIVALQGGFN